MRASGLPGGPLRYVVDDSPITQTARKSHLAQDICQATRLTV
jgi:hypothetical protein